ncbi:uncharacterized protein L199_004064 [Kwoniella botswanensis]|uniref:uncharacterized protein n=1 Tax=Kwoniella botswanensis TaxID=1268659 RepID=UPI00315D1449
MLIMRLAVGGTSCFAVWASAMFVEVLGLFPSWCLVVEDGKSKPNYIREFGHPPLQDTTLTNLFISSSPSPQQNTGISSRTTCSQGTDAGCTDTAQHSVGLTKTSFDNLGCRNRSGGSNTYTCHCSQGRLASVGDSVTCGADLLSPGAQASGLSRRRARQSKDIQARRRRREVEYCPYGLTSCNVAGYTNNYEGVARGASTCVNGKCVASACKKGLRLVDGQSQ